MKKDLFIKISFICLLIFIFTQLIFWPIQSSKNDSILYSINGIVSQEISASNPYTLSQELQSFESLKIIKCSKLVQMKTGQTYFDKSKNDNCDSNFFNLNGKKNKIVIKSINGELWELSFTSINGKEFYLLLWMIRFLFFLLTGLLLYLHKIKLNNIIYKKDLEISEQKSLNESASAILEISTQVSHDIRSPLAALQMALEEVEFSENEYKNIIKNSIQRINDIANNLLNASKSKSNSKIELTDESITQILENIIAEKKVQFKNNSNLEIKLEIKTSRNILVKLDKIEFPRIISNLINNSVEAFENNGKINITLVAHEAEKNLIAVIISDNGKGIPSHIIEKLGQRGISHGKENSNSGSGLGIYHAKKMIETFGGEFKVESKVKSGTTISLFLPTIPSAEIFTNSTSVKFYDCVYIDNDKLLQMIWKARAVKKDIKLLILSSSKEFLEHEKEIDLNQTKIYIDCDLGDGEVLGIDFAITLHKRGFKQLFIATGYEADKFSHLQWLTYAGKNCPF